MYTYHNFFIHSSVDGHLGCFHVLATANSAAMNSGIHGYFSIVISSEYMPRSGIAGSYGGFIPSFFKESPYLVFCLLFLQTSFTKHLVHGVLLAFKSILKYDLCNRKWFSTVDVFEMELKNLSEGRIKHL